VEAKKTDVIPAVSTLPVEDQQDVKSADPEKKKNKKKNVGGWSFTFQISSNSYCQKSQKVLNPVSGKWSEDAQPKVPIQQRMAEMTNLMNKTSEQSGGRELANYTNSDELRPLVSAITAVKQNKPKKKRHSTVRMLPDVGAASSAESQVPEINLSKNPTPTGMLPVTAVTQFMNDLENVFMQFKMRYASELAGTVVVGSESASPVVNKASLIEQEKLPAKLIKKESVDSTKDSDKDSSSDESSDDDKLDDSHSSNTLVDSY